MCSVSGTTAGGDGVTTDRERFEELFERCYDALLAYAVRRSPSAEDAADVVSETFATAWRRVRELPPGDEARLWLYGTARRVLQTHRRGSLRRDALDERLLSHARTLQAKARAVGHDDGPDGLQGAMRSLSEADQELLRLVAWEDLDGVQVAQVLRISPTAARVRLHRARHRLRSRLEAQHDGLRRPDPDAAEARGLPVDVASPSPYARSTRSEG